jgi:hypothetical protein
MMLRFSVCFIMFHMATAEVELAYDIYNKNSFFRSSVQGHSCFFEVFSQIRDYVLGSLTLMLLNTTTAYRDSLFLPDETL